MKEASKTPVSGSLAADLRSRFSIIGSCRTKVFLYGFIFAFVGCTAYITFNPSASTSSPWYNNLFSSASFSSASHGSQLSSIFSYIFPNSSSPSPEKEAPFRQNPAADSGGAKKDGISGAGSGDSVKNVTGKGVGALGSGVAVKNGTGEGVGVEKGDTLAGKNMTGSGVVSHGSAVPGNNSTGSHGIAVQGSGGSQRNQTEKGGNGVAVKEVQAKDGVDTKKDATSLAGKNQTGSGVPDAKSEAKAGVAFTKTGNLAAAKNQTEQGGSSGNVNSASSNKTESTASSQRNGVGAKNQSSKGASSVAKSTEAQSTEVKNKGASAQAKVSNLTASLVKQNGVAAATTASNSDVKKIEDWINGMKKCDIFQGRWVKDDSYPLYPEGSCPHIDEPFNCYLNGRPDRAYQKLRWKPNDCEIPRLNATDMLERLRGKRLVFVGDSLNRNMWESLVCTLRNSVKDKKKVFEASGRREFRTVGSYSFIFKDYNCSVEFFRSPFLVQEWEVPVSDGKTKETLRLDIIERSSSKYKDANVIIFNTGHWWTHEKTSKGKDYYQEGNHVYGELNVVEAFHKALSTWAKWVDTNVNPKKTLVFFRGYSASHFSGGQWNSGGQCDKETEPIKNETYLSSYPPKMTVLESVLQGMKTPVSYLNITRMTDYRKDAHPSIYRKQSLTEEERRSPERYQDCSHWCLPGVPDSWNELLYAQLLIKQHQLLH